MLPEQQRQPKQEAKHLSPRDWLKLDLSAFAALLFSTLPIPAPPVEKRRSFKVEASPALQDDSPYIHTEIWGENLAHLEIPAGTISEQETPVRWETSGDNDEKQEYRILQTNISNCHNRDLVPQPRSGWLSSESVERESKRWKSAVRQFEKIIVLQKKGTDGKWQSIPLPGSIIHNEAIELMTDNHLSAFENPLEPNQSTRHAEALASALMAISPDLIPDTNPTDDPSLPNPLREFIESRKLNPMVDTTELMAEIRTARSFMPQLPPGTPPDVIAMIQKTVLTQIGLYGEDGTASEMKTALSTIKELARYMNNKQLRTKNAKNDPTGIHALFIPYTNSDKNHATVWAVQQAPSTEDLFGVSPEAIFMHPKVEKYIDVWRDQFIEIPRRPKAAYAVEIQYPGAIDTTLRIIVDRGDGNPFTYDLSGKVIDLKGWNTQNSLRGLKMDVPKEAELFINANSHTFFPGTSITKVYQIDPNEFRLVAMSDSIRGMSKMSMSWALQWAPSGWDGQMDVRDVAFQYILLGTDGDLSKVWNPRRSGNFDAENWYADITPELYGKISLKNTHLYKWGMMESTAAASRFLHHLMFKSDIPNSFFLPKSQKMLQKLGSEHLVEFLAQTENPSSRGIVVINDTQVFRLDSTAIGPLGIKQDKLQAFFSGDTPEKLKDSAILTPLYEDNGDKVILNPGEVISSPTRLEIQYDGKPYLLIGADLTDATPQYPSGSMGNHMIQSWEQLKEDLFVKNRTVWAIPLSKDGKNNVLPVYPGDHVWKSAQAIAELAMIAVSIVIPLVGPELAGKIVAGYGKLAQKSIARSFTFLINVLKKGN